MSKFLLHFWTFQRGYKNQSPKIFLKNAKNSHFYVVKFDNFKKAPYFWLFAQCAKALSKCARGGARCAIFAQLRKIWQHWPSAPVGSGRPPARLQLPLPRLALGASLPLASVCGRVGAAALRRRLPPDQLFTHLGGRAEQGRAGQAGGKEARGRRGEAAQCCHTLRIFAILANLRV